MSAAPYDSLNLASHVGDDPAAVMVNRSRVAERLGLPEPSSWWFLDQVHGAAVVTVDRARRDEPPPEADAAVTAIAGVPLVVLTADCAPIALADEVAIGVVHAGWKGLLAGVIPAAVAALRAVGAGPVRAVVGPCIRPERYEFGPADLASLAARFGPSVEARTVEGQPALDLAGAARAALDAAGVRDVRDAGVCTAADPSRWFSHRRDGTTGRQALVAVKGS